MTKHTKETLLEEVKRYAEVDRETLAAETFTSSFHFYTRERDGVADEEQFDDVPRLIWMAQNDGSDEDYGKINWGLGLLSATMENLDRITMVFDSFRATQMTKHDGSEWGRGGMQDAWVNNTVDRDLVYECYSMNICYNDGSFAMASIPYDRVNDTVEFRWDDAELNFTEDGGQIQGFYPTAMFKALTMLKLTDAAKSSGLAFDPTLFGLDPWQARLHILAVGVKMVMKETHWSAMIPGRSEEEAAVIEHSFKDGPFAEGISVLNETDLTEIQDLEEQYDQPAVGSPEWLARLHKDV